MSAFEKGDRVAWHHGFSSQHATGSIVRGEAVPDDAKLATVRAVANEEGTWFEILVDGGKDTQTVTADELVKVAEDE